MVMSGGNGTCLAKSCIRGKGGGFIAVGVDSANAIT